MASSFVFLLLLSGSWSISKGCWVTQAQRKACPPNPSPESSSSHGWAPTVADSQMSPSHSCTHSIPFFLLPSVSLCLLWPRNPKTQRKECSETKSHLTCKLFLLTVGGSPRARAFLWSACGALSTLTTDSSCRRKSHPLTGNSSEVHSLAGGVIPANCLEREKLTHVREIKCKEG